MKFKRILSSLLATALTLTTPLTSFATGSSVGSGIGGNAGGNNAAGAVTSSGGDFSANISNNGNGPTSGKIGIRLSLVDANDPKTIISVDDNGKPRVVDLLYVTEGTFEHQTDGSYNSPLLPAYIYTSVKTQPLGSLADGNVDWKPVYYDQICSQTVIPMEPWLYHNGSSYVSKGEAFVDWCKRNDNNELVIDESGQLFTVTIYGMQAPLVKVDTVTDDTGTWQTYVDSVGWGTKYKTEAFEDNPEAQLEVIFNDWLSDDYIAKFKGTDTDTAATNMYCWLISASRMISEINKTDTAKATTYVGEYNGRMSKIGSTLGQNVVAKIKQLIAAASNSSEGTEELAQQSGLSNEEAEASSQSAAFEDERAAHIVRLLNLKDINTGNFLLQTESVRTGEKENLKDATEDWILLVEPIVWLTIYPEGNTNYVIHSKLYGTITNIVQAFNTDSERQEKYSGRLTDYINDKFFNWKAINQPVWWALTVEKNGFVFNRDSTKNENSLGFHYPGTSDDKISIGSYRTFGQLYETLTPRKTELSYTNSDGETVAGTFQTISGWGVNVYWKDGLVGESIQTTWDPDDPGEPGNDQVKLAKWYVDEIYDEHANLVSQTVTDVKIGKVNRNLAIVNENPGDGISIYEVEKWATGKNQSAVPNEGDLKTTFEEYAKKSPGHYYGEQPAILDLTNNPEDKVVYVKLVHKLSMSTIEETPITVVKVKEPSDGSTPIIEKDVATSGTYNGEDPGWDYKEDTQTPEPEVPVTKWPDVPTNGKPGNTPVIPIEPTTKTIYIRYTEDPNKGAQPEGGQIILYSNELSYGYTLRNLTKNNTLAAIQEYFASHYRGSHRSV